jgi:hypothetical protein
MDPTSSSSSSSSSCDTITNNIPKANASSGGGGGGGGLHSSESIYLLKSDNVFYFNSMTSSAFNSNNINTSRSNSNSSANVTINTTQQQTQTQPQLQVAGVKKNSIEIEEYDENYEEGYLTSLNKENSFIDINQIEDTLPTTTPLITASINTITSPTKTIIPETVASFNKPVNITTLDIAVKDTTVKQQTTPTIINKKNALLLSKKSKSISNAEEPWDLNEKKTNSNVDLNKATTMTVSTTTTTMTTGTTLPVTTLRTQTNATNKTIKNVNVQSKSNLSVNIKQHAQSQSLSTSPKKVKKISANQNKSVSFIFNFFNLFKNLFEIREFFSLT